MNICVNYRMKAYITGEDIDQCRDIWENSNLGDHEFVEVLDVYDEDTLEEIDDF